MKTIFMITVWTLVLSTNFVFSQSADDFVTTWKTDNPGSSNSTSITIPTTGGGYSYDVDWNNQCPYNETDLNSSATLLFGMSETYTVRIQVSSLLILFKDFKRKNSLREATGFSGILM